MHYDGLLPPPPVELKRCQEYFLSPPCHVTKPNLVCDEIMRWKGMGWRLRKLLKHYPTLNEMTQGFTNLIKGIVEANAPFRAKYEFRAMSLDMMKVTTEELIEFFTGVESLLTEFHSSKGYTTVLAPLVDYHQKNSSTKTPKIQKRRKKERVLVMSVCQNHVRMPKELEEFVAPQDPSSINRAKIALSTPSGNVGEL
eukprot:2502725-Amphidinium_carterae.2